VADGSSTLELGDLEGFDASVSSDYESASAIARGDLNVQMAFMTGKIKVGGNMAKVMMHQTLLNEFTRVSSGLDLEF
jgi:putative sterol carrier protein